MIKIFKTPTCAYCVQVQRFFDMKGVKYELLPAEGEEYGRLSQQFGFSVPLVVNLDSGDGMTGYNIGRLKQIAGV